jgi:hypothetical protein
VEHEAGMAIEPGPRLGVLVRPVVIEDYVDDLANRNLGLDGVEKTDELLVATALHAAPDDFAFEHVKCGEQGGRPVALVIVGHRTGPPLPQRQARLAAIERLNLRFLIDREHDRVRRGSI